MVILNVSVRLQHLNEYILPGRGTASAFAHTPARSRSSAGRPSTYEYYRLSSTAVPDYSCMGPPTMKHTDAKEKVVKVAAWNAHAPALHLLIPCLCDYSTIPVRSAAPVSSNVDKQTLCTHCINKQRMM